MSSSAAGPFVLGSDDPWAYDNERPEHVVELPAFRIDRALVTNAEYAEFVAAEGAEHAAALDGRPPSRLRVSPSSTSRSTTPRRTRAGPASACQPSLSGRRR